MTLDQLLTLIHPQGDIVACSAALCDAIGDSNDNELDIGRLLAVAAKALETYRATPVTPINWQRNQLVNLAAKAVKQALRRSVFDHTIPEHTF